MPPELQKAHRELDNAVMKLYEFSKNITESDIVAKLMEMCRKLVESKNDIFRGFSRKKYREKIRKRVLDISPAGSPLVCFSTT
jgi:predicted DNA-binding protein (UPF0278 family)